MLLLILSILRENISPLYPKMVYVYARTRLFNGKTLWILLAILLTNYSQFCVMPLWPHKLENKCMLKLDV